MGAIRFYNMKPLTLLAATATLLCTACTAVHWEHPQYGVSRSSEDLADCQQVAYAQAWNSPYMGGGFGLFGRNYDPRTEETRLQYTCMQAKGYRQVANGG